jgi:hypothetical protein
MELLESFFANVGHILGYTTTTLVGASFATTAVFATTGLGATAAIYGGYKLLKNAISPESNAAAPQITEICPSLKDEKDKEGNPIYTNANLFAAFKKEREDIVRKKPQSFFAKAAKTFYNGFTGLFKEGPLLPKMAGLVGSTSAWAGLLVATLGVGLFASGFLTGGATAFGAAAMAGVMLGAGAGLTAAGIDNNTSQISKKTDDEALVNLYTKMRDHGIKVGENPKQALEDLRSIVNEERISQKKLREEDPALASITQKNSWLWKKAEATKPQDNPQNTTQEQHGQTHRNRAQRRLREAREGGQPSL